MFDRSGGRGQGGRYQDGYGGGDAFMDRMSRMGQDPSRWGDGGYPRPDAGAPMGGDYGPAGITPESEGRYPMPGGPMPSQQRPVYPAGGYQTAQNNDNLALAGLASRVSSQLEEMKALYDRNAACVDEIREIVDGQDRRIRLMLEQAGQAAEAAKNTPQGAASADAVGVSLESIRELLDARSAEDRRLREEEQVRHEQEMEQRQAEEQRRQDERAGLDGARREADAQRQEELSRTLADLQTELTRFSEQMNSVSAGIDAVNGVAERVSERADVTDKNTHDVGVRIYRNVQASMNDYLAKQTSTLDTAITGLNQRMEAMEDSFLHRKSATTPLTVAALVASLVNLGVLVVYILTNY